MNVIIKTSNRFSDGSGFPTVIIVDGFTFSLDYLGEVKCNLIAQTNRKPSKKTIAIAKAVYQKTLIEAPAEWFELNHKMYS